MKLFTEESTYLASAAGGVWLMRPGMAPLETDRGPVELVLGPELDGVRRARVVATPANSGLIVALAAARGANNLTLELGGPPLAAAGPRADPRAELLAARGVGAVTIPSMGGWQAFDDRTLPFYKADACMALGLPVLGTEVARTGLWRRASFAIPVQPDEAGAAAAVGAAIRLVAAIRDPRWFVDPDKPDSSTRLYARLGLGSDPGKVAAAYRGILGMLCVPPAGATRDDFRRPRNFLWRLHAERFENPETAARVAGRALVRFIRGAWLDWLYEETPWVAEPLFVPEHFFGGLFRTPRTAAYGAEVADAYRRHVAGD